MEKVFIPKFKIMEAYEALKDSSGEFFAFDKKDVAIFEPPLAKARAEAADPVNHPSHYQGKGIEAIEVIEAFGLGFSLGNAIKYILRAGKKGDPSYEVQDLEKAVWYLRRRLEIVKAELSGSAPCRPNDMGKK